MIVSFRSFKLSKIIFHVCYLIFFLIRHIRREIASLGGSKDMVLIRVCLSLTDWGKSPFWGKTEGQNKHVSVCMLPSCRVALNFGYSYLCCVAFVIRSSNVQSPTWKTPIGTTSARETAAAVSRAWIAKKTASLATEQNSQTRWVSNLQLKQYDSVRHQSDG